MTVRVLDYGRAFDRNLSPRERPKAKRSEPHSKCTLVKFMIRSFKAGMSVNLATNMFIEFLNLESDLTSLMSVGTVALFDIPSMDTIQTGSSHQ